MQGFLFFMPFNINVKEVFPWRVARGAGVDAVEVDVVVAENGEDVDEASRSVGNAKADGGAVFAAGLGALLSDDGKACCIGRFVLYVGFQNV